MQATITNGVVTLLGEGTDNVPDWVQIGATLNECNLWQNPEVIGTTGGLAAAPVPVHSVTRFQARAALAVAGLFDAVDAIMQSTETPLITRLEWLDKQSFRRDSPTVAWAGERLGLTSDQLDALFVAASEIQI